MSLYSLIARPVLFRLPPEVAHQFTLAAMRLPGLAKAITMDALSPKSLPN